MKGVTSMTTNLVHIYDKMCKRILTLSTKADNRFSYHMEIQMTVDDEIVFRVIEYGFGHAYKNRICEKGKEVLSFPETTQCIDAKSFRNKQKSLEKFNRK